MGETVPNGRSQVVAALPVIDTNEGIIVGLVTSRESGRWIVPKGKLRKNEPSHVGAEREAKEEAGVVGHASADPIARIATDASGAGRAPLFLLEVEEVLEDWPERAVRRRTWQSAAAAAMMVDDPELITVLLNLAGPNA